MDWRLAAPTDDEAVVEMFVALNREDPGQRPVARENMERTLATFRAEPARGRAVVLDIAGRALGYALLVPFWSNEIGGECCTVDELYVRREVRGQGHARSLFQALRRSSELWPRAVVALVLEVSPKNVRAYSLYQKLGFRGENVSLRLRLDGDAET